MTDDLTYLRHELPWASDTPDMSAAEAICCKHCGRLIARMSAPCPTRVAAALQAERARADAAVAMLRRLEWVLGMDSNAARRCPHCFGMENALRRHASGCELHALLEVTP